MHYYTTTMTRPKLKNNEKPNYIPKLLDDDRNDVGDLWDLFIKYLPDSDETTKFSKRNFTIFEVRNFARVYLIHLDGEDRFDQFLQYMEIDEKDITEAADLLTEIWEGAGLIEFVTDIDTNNIKRRYYRIVNE